MTLKKIFLPAGLVLAIIVSLIHDDTGAYLRKQGFIPWLVISIFVFNGYTAKLRDLKFNKSLLKTFIFSIVLSLFAAPFMGLAASKMLGMNAALTTGLVVMCCVPPTLSSGIVLTEVAGGNTLKALFMTIGLNLLGIFTVPFMLALCLKEGENVSVSPFQLLYKLIFLVLCPFLGGMLLKKIIKKDLLAWMRYIPSTCVILTVWLAFSASRDSLMRLNSASMIQIFVGVAAVHILLLIINRLAVKPLKLEKPEAKALLFVGSQKTLPIAVAVLTALKDEPGKAILVCVAFHFTQLLLDSFIASKIAVPLHDKDKNTN